MLCIFFGFRKPANSNYEEETCKYSHFRIGNHTVEFFKKLKLHEPLRRVQFRFLKNSQVQINSKLNSKPYDYLLIIYMKKFA